MRLKQIKLAGFKSFVDATTVTLPGNRCAVVGPNGCGKSNIIDAVRWVMGESSAKQLRGENLTDVIFSGSSARKPTASASIELFFDNSDGRIGGEYAAYAEIAIRRQVSRDGQSNYFLNGSKCRRRDIQDIFLGTGFGPRSYSIIEQGMISQLVEAKPDELRVYLEEAAGISKYKERRRETENRIRHTRENLERINDIREELGRQLDRLQRQAQAAERYRELRIEESTLTAQLYVLKHNALHTELVSREERIQGLEVGLEQRLAQQRELEAQIEKQRQEHAEGSDQFNDTQGHFYRIGADIARAEEAIQFNEERVKQLRSNLENAQQRDIEIQEQLKLDEAQIEDLQNKINELVPQVTVLSSEDHAAQEHLESVDARMREWQTRWDDFNAEAAKHERQTEVLGSRLEHLEQLVQRLKRRDEELHQLHIEESDAPVEEIDQLAAEVSELESQARLLELQIDDCLKELANAREDVVDRERELEQARGEVQELRHELAALQAVQDKELGQVDQEASGWIEAHGLSTAHRLGESIAVAPGWELAIETVLEHFLSALQVDTLDELSGALSSLEGGGLTLVVSTTTIDPGAVNPALDLPPLSTLVRSGGEGAFAILHGVYAAQSAAVALAEREHLRLGESIITRDGFWVSNEWVRVVHDGVDQTGIIERGQTIETLVVRVEEAERTLARMQHDLQEGRDRVEQLEQQRESLQAAINSANEKLSERRTEHGVTRVKLEEADARRARINRESEEIASQLAQETAELTNVRQELVTVARSQEQHADQRAPLSR